MRGRRAMIHAVLLVISATALAAPTSGFRCQILDLPANVTASRFADIENRGRADLLAADPIEKKLLIFRQRASGFASAPDQLLALPPQTAWIALCDVDAHPGLELLVSTADGLVYFHQDAGIFEPEPRAFIKAAQVFTNDDSIWVISLPTNSPLPIISATEAVMYQRNSAFAWSRGRPFPLEAKHTRWFGRRDQWTLGPNAAHKMQIYCSLKAKPDPDDQEPENEAIRKLVNSMKKDAEYPWFGMNRADLDGDGRPDFLLWHVLGDKLYPKTDLYVFLRGADGKLPERPIQVLHCRGFPIPVGSTEWPSPIGDLKGDGRRELVLLELRTTFTSVNSLVEMLVSRGLDWGLTIRSFREGGFSRSPEATVPLKGILLSEDSGQWPLFICGDFNGDGRPDFVVQRSATQWNILFSTQDRARQGWFAPEPAMTFETPMTGYFEVKDLNCDERADIILRAMDEPRLCIFLSQSPPTKGNHP